MKNVIRLNESQIKNIVQDTVFSILNEDSFRKAAKEGYHMPSANKKRLKNLKKNDGPDYKRKNYVKSVRKYEENNPEKDTQVVTESQLHNVIKESVKNVLNEAYGTTDNKTRKTVQDIRSGTDYSQDLLSKIRNDIGNLIRDLKDPHYKFEGDDRYIKIALKYVNEFNEKIEKLFQYRTNKYVQYQGEQPHSGYDWILHTPEYDRTSAPINY